MGMKCYPHNQVALNAKEDVCAVTFSFILYFTNLQAI